MTGLRLLDGRTALVTGGTAGLGRAIALELTRAGAWVAVTQRWGSADPAEFAATFADAGVPAPMVLDADASDPTDTPAVMRALVEARTGLDILVSNVAFGRTATTLDDLTRSALDLSLRYSAWPVVDYLRSARAICGRFPAHVVAVSSLGPERWYPGYDLIAAAKSALDTLCGYLAFRLRAEGIRINVLKPGLLDTPSARQIFGDAIMNTMQARGLTCDPVLVARACLALCSGLLDGMTGRSLVVDHGNSLLGDMALVANDRVGGSNDTEEQ